MPFMASRSGGIKSEEQTARAATCGLWNLLSVACSLVIDVSRNELVKSFLTRIFMEIRLIRGMSTAKAQLVLKLKTTIYGKCCWFGLVFWFVGFLVFWLFFLLSTRLWG